MRNLKKILAMTLALVMSFTLVITANAATFSDSESINATYAEAIDVLDALGVFKGYEDGDSYLFKPEQEISRAEVSAIIYRIVTGDVEDKQVGIYSDYNKFSDVKSTDWFAGYVNYCANAEYIKGYGNGTFGPNDKVTGYQAIAMILRAVGYDKNGEFTGANWQIQTASVANQLGITANVVEGTLGAAAPRQVVAELLFRSILTRTVNYSTVSGYSYTDTTLAKKTFGMVKLDGIIVANDYANLEGTSTLSGQTRIKSDGVNYTINYDGYENTAEGLDVIGEARYVYATQGAGVKGYDMVVDKLYEEDGLNTVYDEGDAAYSSSAAASVGLTLNSTTAYYQNYDPAQETTTDWLIRYVIDLNPALRSGSTQDQYWGYVNSILGRNATLTTAPAVGTYADQGFNDGDQFEVTAAGEYLFTKTIHIGDTLTTEDMILLEAIFDNANRLLTGYIYGEVYVGTTQVMGDQSDIMSWAQFQNTYLNIDEDSTISSNAAGNRLKIVDNDADGIADYVLQTIYTVGIVKSVSSSGTITLTLGGDDVNASGTTITDGVDDINSISGVSVASEDELAAGNPVIYAVIDGVARANLAECISGVKVNSVNRNDGTATFSNGETYEESGICEHVSTLGSGVSGLAGRTNYDLYLDNYGYLAAYTDAVENGEYVLITDAWFNQTRDAKEYAVRIWNGSTFETRDVVENAGYFINETGNNNSWGKLWTTFGTNGSINNSASTDGTASVVNTIVASIEQSGDSWSLAPVDKVYYQSEDAVRVADLDKTIPNKNAGVTGTIYHTDYLDYPAYDVQDDVNADIRPLSTTTYYYVYRGQVNNLSQDGSRNLLVNQYTGYANAPSIDKEYIEDVYAVVRQTTSDTNHTYYVADVVVVELNDSYNSNAAEQIFLVDLPNVSYNTDGSISVAQGIETASVVRSSGAKEDIQIDLTRSSLKQYNTTGGKSAAGLYYMTETATAGVYVITAMSDEQIRDSGNYVAGTVRLSRVPNATDWTEITDQNVDAAGNAVNTGTYSQVKNSGGYYYTLSGRSLTTSTQDVVMSESKDVTYLQGDHLNEVLVYTAGGSSVIYAISFNEWSSYPTTQNAAQTTYVNCLPAAAAAVGAHTLTFYGAGIQAGTGTSADPYTIAVSYTTALANAANALTVENADSYIVVNAATNQVIADTAIQPKNVNTVYTVTVTDKSDNVYYYTLTQTASSAAALTTSAKGAANGVAVDEPTKTIQGPAVVDATGAVTYPIPSNWTITEFVNSFEISPNATAKWTFETYAGEHFSFTGMTPANVPSGVTTTEVKGVNVVVVSEDGTVRSVYSSAYNPGAETKTSYLPGTNTHITAPATTEQTLYMTSASDAATYTVTVDAGYELQSNSSAVTVEQADPDSNVWQVKVTPTIGSDNFIVTEGTDFTAKVATSTAE